MNLIYILKMHNRHDFMLFVHNFTSLAVTSMVKWLANEGFLGSPYTAYS